MRYVLSAAVLLLAGCSVPPEVAEDIPPPTTQNYGATIAIFSARDKK